MIILDSKKSELNAVFRYLLVVIVLFFVALGFIRGIAYFLLKTSLYNYQEWNSKRAREMVSFLEYLKTDPSLVRIFFFGPSTTVIGVRAKQIEKFLRQEAKNKVEVLNLGIFDLESTNMRNQLRRIREMNFQKQRKIDIALVDFQPDRLTKRVSQRKDRSPVAASEANLFSIQMILEDLVTQPSSALHTMHVKYLLNGRSPSLARDICYRALWNLFNTVKFQNQKPESGLFDLSNQFWHFDRPNVRGWDLSTNGHFYFDLSYVDPNIFARIKEFKIPRIRNYLRSILDHNWDTSRMVFDENATQQFKENIRLLQTMTKKVVVYYLPQAPDLQVNPEAWENITLAHR